MWIFRIWLLPIMVLFEFILLSITLCVSVYSPKTAGSIGKWAENNLPNYGWYLGNE